MGTKLSQINENILHLKNTKIEYYLSGVVLAIAGILRYISPFQKIMIFGLLF